MISFVDKILQSCFKEKGCFLLERYLKNKFSYVRIVHIVRFIALTSFLVFFFSFHCCEAFVQKMIRCSTLLFVNKMNNMYGCTKFDDDPSKIPLIIIYFLNGNGFFRLFIVLF